MVAAAVIGSAVVGGVVASKSADKAADAQKAAAGDATALQKYQYDQTRADNMPALDARNAGLARLQDLLGLSKNTKAEGYGSLNDRFTGADLENEPGYQFGLNEGLDSAQNSAAARGGLYSGATLKALTKYGNDYASTKYGDAYNRFNNDQAQTYNRLAGVVGSGQTGAGTIAQAGQNYADAASANMIGAGNARAASSIATGNAVTGALNQGTAWWMNQQPTAAVSNPAWTVGNSAGSGLSNDGFYTDPYGGA